MKVGAETTLECQRVYFCQSYVHISSCTFSWQTRLFESE